MFFFKLIIGLLAFVVMALAAPQPYRSYGKGSYYKPSYYKKHSGEYHGQSGGYHGGSHSGGYHGGSHSGGYSNEGYGSKEYGYH